jgi:hypothetical protein
MNKKMIIRDIKKALFISNVILKFREIGIQGEVTKEQLNKYIIPELSELLNMVVTDDSNLSCTKSLKCFDLAFKMWGWNISSPSILFGLLNKISKECQVYTSSNSND